MTDITTSTGTGTKKTGDIGSLTMKIPAEWNCQFNSLAVKECASSKALIDITIPIQHYHFRSSGSFAPTDEFRPFVGHPIISSATLKNSNVDFESCTEKTFTAGDY